MTTVLHCTEPFIIYCYNLALLPLIVCLGRFHIACRYILTVWHLHQGVSSLVQGLEHWIFIRTDQVQIPWKAGNFFSYASFLCCDFHVIRWGLVRDRTLFSQKWLCIIINEDFLEKGECYDLALLPLIICLGRFRIACRYIFTLWWLHQGVDSLAQWLEHWIFIRTDQVQIPRKAGNFFSYASFLCCDFQVIKCPR